MAQPKISSASNTPFPATVVINFDSDMLNDSDLVNTSNYLFNKGAYTTDVVVLDIRKVLLVVQNLYEHADFTVTVNNVKNLSSEVIDPSFNSGTFYIDRPTIPGYALALTSANGRLKSGSAAIKVAEGEDSWFVMTETGVDVISKASLMNTGFILSTEGYNAIHVG